MYLRGTAELREALANRQGEIGSSAHHRELQWIPNGSSGRQKLNSNSISAVPPPCEMYQTQTFVHLIILLFPRPHCEPRPVKSMAIAILSKIRTADSASCRFATRS
jgi:hypothetical protein